MRPSTKKVINIVRTEIGYLRGIKSLTPVTSYFCFIYRCEKNRQKYDTIYANKKYFYYYTS